LPADLARAVFPARGRLGAGQVALDCLSTMVPGLAWIGLRSARIDPGPVVAIAVVPTLLVSAVTISAVPVRCV
jgi:hypothetical protein